MKAIEKIELLEKVGLELQSRMTFDEIDMYFLAHGVEHRDITPSANSKRIYAKEVLVKESDSLLFEIAEELGVYHDLSSNLLVKDTTFWKSGYFKLFLSHLASFKISTSNLQSILKRYGISSFVAHEDIEPSKEWQDEIEAALKTMDALAAILMPGFKESKWCDQEVGFAVGRDVLIIPVRRGLDPYGFIAKYQGIQAKEKTVGEVAELIFTTLIKSPKTRQKMLKALSSSISQSTDVEEAIEKYRILKSVDSLPVDILENLKLQILDNSVLNDSSEFIILFNSLLSKYNVQNIRLGQEIKEVVWDEDIPF